MQEHYEVISRNYENLIRRKDVDAVKMIRVYLFIRKVIE